MVLKHKPRSKAPPRRAKSTRDDTGTRAAIRTRARTSKSDRPIMRLLDILSRRWSLRVIWELRGTDPLTSRALRAACGDLSPTVLQSRLTELRNANLVELEPRGGYQLSPQGKELLKLFLPLHFFAERWALPLRADPD
jgi:DNA-binding HxlR family transcriptional regulator